LTASAYTQTLFFNLLKLRHVAPAGDQFTFQQNHRADWVRFRCHADPSGRAFQGLQQHPNELIILRALALSITEQTIDFVLSAKRDDDAKLPAWSEVSFSPVLLAPVQVF
jgi:hypothetical protein